MAQPLRFFLKKADRLLNRSEFTSLSDTGRRLNVNFFIALVAPSKADRSRIGITISRKVGGAVERNRLKRLAREVFRVNRHRFARPIDISLIARRSAAGQTNRGISQALKDFFDKLPRQIEN